MKEYDFSTLESLKKEYKSIPVPPEAKERIRQGIRQAHEASAGEGTKEKPKTAHRRLLRILRPTAATAAAAAAAITILANVSPVTAQAMEQIPVISSIAKVVTFRTFEDEQNGYQANISIPQVTDGGAGQEAVNRSIEEYAQELIALYEKEVAASHGQEGHYSMDSSYEVVADTDRYLSIRINTTVTMASGAQYVKIFTIDRKTGEILSLLDVLGNDSGRLDAVSNNIKEQMRAQMAADSQISYFLDSDMPDFDFKGLTGQENFYFNSNGELVIVFDEYEVAPGYMGAVEFVIPKSVTEN
ncbi:MAG: DUF3298 domain-containing protein [Lachnospiraceae bacterium]|nr:DUF3298 domain-containing protein [Lachnospiraceae bacterium]